MTFPRSSVMRSNIGCCRVRMWSTVMCVAWFENWICLKSFWVGKSLDGILLYTTSFNHRWPMVNGQPNGAERVLFYAIKLWHTSCQPQPPAKASEKKLSWCVFAGSGSLLRCKFCEGFSQDPKLPSLISIPQQDSCVFGVQVILLATTSAPPRCGFSPVTLGCQGENEKGEINDVCSFYNLPSTILGNLVQ